MRRQAIILLAMTWLMLGIVSASRSRAWAASEAAAVQTASPRGPVLVSKVTVDTQKSDETFVDVSTSRSVTYRVTTLPNPARLVIDIDDAQNTAVQKTYAADTAVLKSVRIGQFRAPDPSVVRVVADLNGNPAFNVYSTPAGVRIELRPRGPVARRARSPARSARS